MFSLLDYNKKYLQHPNFPEMRFRTFKHIYSSNYYIYNVILIEILLLNLCQFAHLLVCLPLVAWLWTSTTAWGGLLLWLRLRTGSLNICHHCQWWHITVTPVMYHQPHLLGLTKGPSLTPPEVTVGPGQLWLLLLLRTTLCNITRGFQTNLSVEAQEATCWVCSQVAVWLQTKSPLVLATTRRTASMFGQHVAMVSTGAGGAPSAGPSMYF